jgi:hypothetical protein
MNIGPDGGGGMFDETYMDLLSEREAAMAFNMGLKTAIYILEMAEELSPEGRIYLVDQLKKQVADSEVDYAVELIHGMPAETRRGSHLISLKSGSR